MKLFFFLIAFFFIFSSFSFAKTCSVQQKFWKTSGISACTFGTGTNGAGIEVLHYLSPSTKSSDTCKERAFVCDLGGTPSQTMGINLPPFVEYDENQKDYPYKCGGSSDAWTQNLVFKGAHD